ncbi:MAG: OB-fold nucleic acid binding domain-containing protein [Nanoarchaeota archaeon]
MAEEKDQFKRNVAFKLRIGDVAKGNPIIENERFHSLDLEGKKIVRVNVIGSVVDKYESNGEKKFLFVTIDDGSGQIKLKTFGDDISKFSSVSQGQTVAVIGVLRFFNNEVYISPEIVREFDPKYLLVRKLELEKGSVKLEPKNESFLAIRDKIIELIKNSESEGGIDAEKISSYTNSPSELIGQEIQKLLEEGIIFEPRPGRVRWLG